MANTCSWGPNATYWSGSGANWGASSQCVVGGGGIKNPYCLFDKARQAAGTPFYFDANEFNIVCTAFPSAGGAPDPLISQAAAITQLQTSLTAVQSDVQVLQVQSSASDPQFSDRLADQGDVWLLFLGAAIVVFLGRALYNLFDRAPHGE